MKPPPDPTIVPKAPTAIPIRTSRPATAGENVSASRAAHHADEDTKS